MGLMRGIRDLMTEDEQRDFEKANLMTFLGTAYEVIKIGRQRKMPDIAIASKLHEWSVLLQLSDEQVVLCSAFLEKLFTRDREKYEELNPLNKKDLNCLDDAYMELKASGLDDVLLEEAFENSAKNRLQIGNLYARLFEQLGDSDKVFSFMQRHTRTIAATLELPIDATALLIHLCIKDIKEAIKS